MDSTRCTCFVFDDHQNKMTYIRSHQRSKHLSKEENMMLHDSLRKYEFLFDETLRIWKLNLWIYNYNQMLNHNTSNCTLGLRHTKLSSIIKCRGFPNYSCFGSNQIRVEIYQLYLMGKWNGQIMIQFQKIKLDHLQETVSNSKNKGDGTETR